MALLPKIQNDNVYSFKDALLKINPSNFVLKSDISKAISTDLYNRVYQAEKQSNEELIDQLKDMFVIRDMIADVPDEIERNELYSQFSSLQRALSENSSSLKAFSKSMTNSFMKKSIGKNGQFSQLQDILTSVGSGIKGEMFPIFQSIIDQTSTFFKNSSDRRDRVEQDIMNNVKTSTAPFMNDDTDEEQIARKSFSDVTNGESPILKNIDSNVETLLSKFKTEDGRIDAFKIESFLSEFGGNYGEYIDANSIGNVIRDILSTELSSLSKEQLQEFKESMASERGTEVLEQNVSFEGYSKEEKSVIVETIKEVLSSQADDLLVEPKRELKDFSTLEAQEEYQNDSIKEQRRMVDGIEKLSDILKGDNNRRTSSGSSSGGVLSSLIDSGKNLSKMGLDVFFGKNKVSKAGGLFKKAGGWLTALGGGALLSGGRTSDIGDVATNVLTDTATDKVADALKSAGTETVKDSAVKKSGKGIFGSAGKKIAKNLGGAGAKSLLKKIPGISILAGAGFGLSRLLEGDFTGALGELASGVAGTVPGMGTVVSTAIDAGLTARDISKETEDVIPQKEMNSGMSDNIIERRMSNLNSADIYNQKLLEEVYGKNYSVSIQPQGIYDHNNDMAFTPIVKDDNGIITKILKNTNDHIKKDEEGYIPPGSFVSMNETLSEKYQSDYSKELSTRSMEEQTDRKRLGFLQEQSFWSGGLEDTTESVKEMSSLQEKIATNYQPLQTEMRRNEYTIGHKMSELIDNRANQTSNINLVNTRSNSSSIIQHPSNSTKNDAYTSQPTRIYVPEKKDPTKQDTKQQPTVINNFNTTNNNVTQSASQKSPQLIINPSSSYMGERQPTAR